MRRLLLPLVALAAVPAFATGCRATYPALDEAERAEALRRQDSVATAEAELAAQAYADSLAAARRAATDEALRRRTATVPPTTAPATPAPATASAASTPPRPASRPAPPRTEPRTDPRTEPRTEPRPVPAPSTPVPPARDPGLREPDGPAAGSDATAEFGRPDRIVFVDSALVDELFQPASATVSDVGKAILDRIAYEISRQPAGLRVRIEGHADSTPPGPTMRERWPSNWDLAAARAATVARYLAEKGVPETRMEVVSYGSTRPVAPNDTPQNRALNRRIVVLVG